MSRASVTSTRRRRTLALAGILGALLLLALLAGPRGGAPEGDLRPSTYLSSSEGTRALFLVLELLEIPVDRLRAPWDAGLEGPGLEGGGLDSAGLDRPGLEGASHLVVLEPTFPPDPETTAALVRWVEGGGTLILVANPETALARTLAPSDASATAEAAGEAPTTGTPAAGTPVTDARRADDAALASSASDAPRTLRRGLGRVVHFADVDPFRNDALREDPAPAERLVALFREGEARRGPVLFDEYVHGFQGEGSPARALADFLLSTPWGRWTLQGLVGVLLLLVAFGARFGSPFPPPLPPLRTPLEHAEALAGVYRKAGAVSTARRNLLAGLARRLRVRPGALRADGPASPADGRAPPADRAPLPAFALPAALRELPSAATLETALDTPGEAGLLALARAGDALEAERRQPQPPVR